MTPERAFEILRNGFVTLPAILAACAEERRAGREGADMTPERVLAADEETAMLKRQIEAQAILAHDGDSRAVIRYAALTEAAEACREQPGGNGNDCAAAIEALRDKT